MADCIKCKSSLPAGSPGSVNTCEKCFISLAFPGRTAGIMLVSAEASPFEYMPMKFGYDQPPAKLASDKRIAGTVGVQEATVRGARLYNEETYKLFTFLEARQDRRITASYIKEPLQYEADMHEGDYSAFGGRFGFLFALFTIAGIWAYLIWG